MSDKSIFDVENVARAIFHPSMLDANGNVSLSSFVLRHNESYYSVARMAIDGWMNDIKLIPQNPQRQLCGYCKLNVGEVRNLGFTHDENSKVVFDVQDKSSSANKSHAGIEVLLGEDVLKGDKTTILKPLPSGVSASGLLLRIQTKLVQLACKNYVKMPESQTDTGTLSTQNTETSTASLSQHQ